MIRVRDLIGEENIDYILQKSPNFIEEPLVSILMPTYCRGDNGLLKRAIESVLDQSFQNFELIIIDDGSVDLTRRLVQRIMEKETRILYIRNHKNSGLPSVRVMQGFFRARGRYIAYQFDDDRWYPDALQTMVDFIREQGENCFAYGACDYIKVLEEQKLVLGDRSVRMDDIFRVNTIPNNTVIHDRSLFEKYGSYDPHLFLRRLTDWDLWKRWMQSGAVVRRIPQVLSIVEEQRSGSLYDSFDSDIALTRIIGGLPPDQRNRKLTPENYYDYEIDDLSFIKDEETRCLLYERKIAPYYAAHPELLRRLRCRSFIKDPGKKTLLISKKNYAVDKDRALTRLLQEENPCFHSFYMQSEHIPLDPSALDYAQASLLIGKTQDFSQEALEILSAKPSLLLSEEEFSRLSPDQLLDRLQEEAKRRLSEQEEPVHCSGEAKEKPSPSETERHPSQNRGEVHHLSEEEIDLFMEKNLLIEEQATEIRKLRHKLQDLMGYGGEEGDSSGGAAADIADLCEEYDHLRFDIKTKLIRHLTRADYEGNRQHRGLIRSFGQESLAAKGYYIGWSSFLSENGEELAYPLQLFGKLPESIEICASNYNPWTKVIVARLQIVGREGFLLADIPLRGVDILHREVTRISLDLCENARTQEINGEYILRLKALPISRSCGIRLLEWKIRGILGKIRDKQLACRLLAEEK